MNRRSFLTGIAAMAVAPALSVPALGAFAIRAWTLIGSKRVSWFLDTDTIFVGRSRGRFRSIRLRVRGNSIRLLDLKVYFVNGGVQDVHVRSFIPAGGQTRTIDLNGDARFIAQIRMTYRRPTLFFGPTATVEVWGRR